MIMERTQQWQEIRSRSIWACELHDLLMAFPPDLAYVAASRVMTRLRRMRLVVPIWNTTSVMWSYRATIWDVVVSTLACHEEDKPDFLSIADNNRLHAWAENIASRIYASLDIYSNIYTGWNLPVAWPSGEARLLCERVALLPVVCAETDDHYMMLHPSPQPLARQASFTSVT